MFNVFEMKQCNRDQFFLSDHFNVNVFEMLNFKENAIELNSQNALFMFTDSLDLFSCYFLCTYE